MTELCGVCGFDVHFDIHGDGELEEFYYDRDSGWHVACRPRKGIDAMPVETGFVQKHAGKKGETPFGFDLCPDPANHPNDPSDWKVGADHDTLYSYQKRDRGPDVILNQYIEVTYSQNESGGKVYLNVESWREVAAPEGQPSAEKVIEVAWTTAGEAEDRKNVNIHRSVALQQAVALYGTLDSDVTIALYAVEEAYLHFLKLLTNPASLREPGDVDANAAGRAPKAVLDHNGPRDEEGYLIKASDADRASQDAQGAPAEEYPPDHPKHVSRPV